MPSSSTSDGAPNASGRTSALAPLQAGMLYEAVLHGVATGGGGVNVEQLHGSVEALAPEPFAAAWTFVARRHPLLSSALRWEDVDAPRREEHPGVTVPFVHHDWSSLSPGEARVALERFLEDDRRRGFDLGRAPLLRVALFTRGGGRSEFVWTFHHVLLDGRSFPLVLEEVFAAYAALAAGRQPVLPPPARDYGDFVAWLERRDPAPSLEYFGALLRGKTRPTPLPGAAPKPTPRSVAARGDRTLVVGAAAAAAARQAAVVSGTSLATVVYAAWARVLARATGEGDVVFGVTRAGRHSALDGDTAAMLGLFIATPPVRVDARPAVAGADLLASLFRQTRALRAHEHTPLYLIRGRSEFHRGEPLFETAVMFETRDLDCMLRERGTEWQRRNVTLYEQPALPLMLTAFGGPELVLRALFDPERLPDASVTELLSLLEGELWELGRSL